MEIIKEEASERLEKQFEDLLSEESDLDFSDDDSTKSQEDFAEIEAKCKVVLGSDWGGSDGEQNLDTW